MNAYGPRKLTAAVAAICPDVLARMARPILPPDERSLWWELSSCILSSQVPYALASAAADAIDERCLLLEGRYNFDELMRHLVEVLSSPLLINGRSRFYRFPVARAHHLAAAHTFITTGASSLRNLLDRFHNAADARSWFVEHAPGLGPKQASMFLRNAGVSYDLAILDRHVLNYMSALGIYSGAKPSITGFAQYRRCEATLREHADELDCPVGLLDWAIWIVMRVANRKMEPATA